MSEAELDEIISHLDDQYQSIALVMAYTGLDLSDAVNLKWRDVSLKDGMIRTKRGKICNRISIPLAQVVSNVLLFRNRVRRLHDDRVFNVGTQGFQKAWKRSLKKSGVDWNVRVKDLRHYFGSYMLNNGVEPVHIAELMRHSSLERCLKKDTGISMMRLLEKR